MDLPWVESLIQAKFYVTCQCGWKDSTYFCIQCLGLPFCEVCKTNKHSGHNFLQVYKASYQVAIKIGEINELLDTSDLQSYVTNSKGIVYLTERQSKGQHNDKGGEGHGSGTKCETCGWANLCEPAKYCSLECKVCLSREAKEESKETEKDSQSKLKSDIVLQKSNQKLVFRASANSASSSQTTSSSNKKRSRKGVPIRSPLT